MADERVWRVTRGDSEDLGFALSCLIMGAVSLEEFKAWIYLVLEQSDEFPAYLIDLTDFEHRHELLSDLRDLIGFFPAATLSSREEKALAGIGYARFEDFRHDTIRRGEASTALHRSDALRTRFARCFPSIRIPDEERTAGASAQDRRASTWRMVGVEHRPLTIAEVQTLFINRMAASQLTMILESDTGMVLHLVTNRQRVRVVLTGPGDMAGHAIDAEAEGMSGGYVLENGHEDDYPDRDTVTIPAALNLISDILAHGTPPQRGWHIDSPL